VTSPERVERLIIVGRVQGVGFRDWLRWEAEGLGIEGWVRNLPSGAVEAVVAGVGSAVDVLVARCEDGPPAARVERVERSPASTPEGSGFRVIG